MAPAESARMSTRRPGRVSRPVAGQLPQCVADDRDVIGRSVRPGVPGPQQHRQRLTGAGVAVVDECPQRVEPEPALERRRRALLVRVCGDQGGVHIDDQRLVRCGAVVWGVFAGHRPYSGPSLSAGSVDRRQHPVSVAGEGVHRP